MSAFGKPVDRVDGRAKVTGSAQYAVEFPVAGLAHAVIAGASIGRGRIRRIDARAAERSEGVLAVLTHENAMRLPAPSAPRSPEMRPIERALQVLQDAEVHYSGQPIAVVVADTIERAAHAASLVTAEYDSQPFVTDMEAELSSAVGVPDVAGEPPEHARGDVDRGLAAAHATIDVTYTTPPEHHNPMEMHATTAVWEGPDRLTLHDATQGVFPTRDRVASLFGLPVENVRVVAKFVGGGFGSKGSVWSHVMLAAMAARHVSRPVRLMVTRAQMFSFVGFRPRTIQRVQLGAKRSGALTAIVHEAFSQTSRLDDFVEPSTAPTKALYKCENVRTSQRVVRLDTSTPTFMRAPGESTGTFALESAMDELSYALGMDPIELRRKNHADVEPSTGKRWSSKSLEECYRRASERFHWSRRDPVPRTMRDGRLLVGLGMATATYPMHRRPASAIARLAVDGTALVLAGSQDIGPGTYTSMTQVAAGALSMPVRHVRFELGDTEMPPTPISGGSMTAASTGSAVHEACRSVIRAAIDLAVQDSGSPLFGLSRDDVIAKDGHLRAKGLRGRNEAIATLLRRNGLPFLEARADSAPGAEAEAYAMRSFGAQFCEVRVDPDLGTVRVARWVAAFATGRIINPKMARSQFRGGIVFGIGMALLEKSVMDPRNGRFVTRDLGSYHVPVNLDVPEIEVLSVEEDDPHVNPIGVKGIGEIGITGAAAAIANAVYHATGKRVRDLPITLDKLL